MSVEPIDAVVTWVDGNDPVWAAKRAKYFQLSADNEDSGAVRYDSKDEILYCVGSILRFAPYMRKIHIVTDHQTPQIFDRLRAEFGDAVDKIVIVDHTEIFAGYEDCLPTFNSISIEMMLCFIPDLKEQFVYFNDDVFLVAPSQPADFFKSRKPVLRGGWQSVFPIKVRNALENLLVRTKPFGKDAFRLSSKLTQMQGAMHVSQDNRYFRNGHTPLPFRASVISDFLRTHRELLLANIAPKSRERGQFNIASVAFALELQDMAPDFEPLHLVYVNPYKRRDNSAYVKRKLASVDRDGAKFLCLQSLSYLRPDDIKYVQNWLDTKIFKS